ncbi:OmpA family protein [Photobacterium damselae]|uniref:OmpA family protein n=1 Tax=Photobacterium damselae TaxID=38293 RepID=UPI004068F47F
MKHTLIIPLAAIIISTMSGCATTDAFYSENPTTVDQLLAESGAISPNDNSVDTNKIKILSELSGGLPAEHYIGVLRDSGADLSALNTPTIHFDFDSYSLSDDAKRIISKHAEILKREPKMKVILEGHTDEVGDRAYNLKLGEKRALAVKNYATSIGVLPAQIEVVSLGEEKPIIDAINAKANKENRRAVFVYK